MQRLLYALLALLLVNPAFAAMHSLYVGTGTATNTVGAGDAYFTDAVEVDGPIVGDTVAVPVDDTTPDVSGGNTFVTGVNTVPTAITVLDNELVGGYYTIICGDVANASTIADAGNFALNGAWVPATIGDSITLYVVAADTYYETERSYVVAGPVEGDPFRAGPDAVGAPGYTWIGDLDSGMYRVGADNIAFATNGAIRGDFDNTGLNNCDIGATTPATLTATTGTFTGDVDFSAGLVGQPSLTFTGDLDTGRYWIGADSFADVVGGAAVLTYDATGVQGALGQTTPAAADVTTLTTTGITDLVVGAVGAPSLTFTGDADTGLYQVGADDFGISAGGAISANFDATGIVFIGGNGPIGTVTPDAGTFTNVDVGGTFNFGQDPADLVAGFKEIGDYVTFVETFDVGNDADLAVRWDLTNLAGLGTNEETTLDGWNALITGGGAGPDWESTRSNGLNHNAAYAPRIECVVDLGAIAAGQTFYFGFWAAAARYAEIIHEPATSANWLLRVDDTAGAETIDSGVAATLNPTKLEISVTAGGVVDWAIDDVDMATAGLTNLMANDHYVEWRILDVAAAAHTVWVDYFISEQLKQQ